VPHFAQKVRVTGGEERNSTGLPRVKAEVSRATVIHATTGEPATRRQLVQWQIIVFSGLPRAR
jgi:hypothetical protein